VPKRARRALSPSIGSRVGYRIDRFLGLHPAVQVAFVVGIALMLAGAFGFAIFFLDRHGGAPATSQPSAPWTPSSGRVASPAEGLWWAVTRMVDGGTVASDTGALHQLFGLGVTLVGLVAVAVLTGSFASSFSERLRDLRRGTLPVFEEGHVVFLGWNVHGGVILRELALSGMRATLVILADHPREDIEETVREHLERRAHHLDVVVRRGDPTTTAGVRRAAVQKARAVVILPEVPSAAASPAKLESALALGPGACLDRFALRSLLAVRRVLGDRQTPVSVPVLVDVATPRGAELARLCDDAPDTVVVDGHGVSARLLAQAVRQEGAFEVMRQLLSLDARSVFVHDAASFAGKTFDEAHAAIDDGVLIGLADGDTARLSPDGAHLIGEGEKLLVFSDTSRAPRLAGAGAPASPDEPRESIRPPSVKPAVLDVLVLRYRPELAEILRFLDEHGESRVTVMVRAVEVPRVTDALSALSLPRTAVEVMAGDPIEGASIERALAIPRDVALLLAPDVSPAEAADADADQIISLLHLRRAGACAPRAVLEIRSQESKRLTHRVAGREDFLIKRETVGMLLAQELHAICRERACSDDRAGAWVGPVYNAVLEAVGPSLELRPLASYARGEAKPSFGKLLAVARRRGQVAIGVAEDDKPPLLLPPREARFDAARARLVVIHARACVAGEGEAQRRAADAQPGYGTTKSVVEKRPSGSIH
jgi:Castor and Pollux, part of voltage-gated ion channel